MHFEELVEKHEARGKTKAEAVQLAVRENPTAHAVWLEEVNEIAGRSVHARGDAVTARYRGARL